MAIAIAGIYISKERTQKERPIQFFFAVLALIAALTGVAKAVFDEWEKERLRESRIGPSPASIRALEVEVGKFAKEKRYEHPKWYDGGDGLSFVLERGPETGAIVLSKHDLGNLVEKGVTDEMPKLIAEHTSEDYGLAVLLEHRRTSLVSVQPTPKPRKTPIFAQLSPAALHFAMLSGLLALLRMHPLI